jgi:hypothetical protein
MKAQEEWQSKGARNWKVQNKWWLQ